ncbi:DUF3021 domain-containing protein [Paenibacillus sp. CAU 1782]
MVRKIIQRGFVGISSGGIITFVALTVLMINEVDVSVADIWRNMLGSILMGIYFGIASLLFEHEKWSPLKQLVVHFLMSILLFFPIAISVGWIEFQWRPILLGAGTFMIIYAIFWFSISGYLRRQARSMNNSVRK